MIRRILIGAALLSVAAAIVSGQTTRSTYDGVYTAAQAARGKATFEGKCTGCHEPSRFSGKDFQEEWDGKPLKEIWDIASGTMPEDNPGSLKQQEYGDIIAYFLSLNEFPAGEKELEATGPAMAAIKIEKKSVASPGAQAKKSVKAGVYAAAQADRGIAIFRSKCASCHAPNRFTDDLFYTSFAGKPLWEMFDVISDSMPEDNPGSLKKEEYADVIAYLLKLNKFPAGNTDLPTGKEALSAIMMEKP